MVSQLKLGEAKRGIWAAKGERNKLEMELSQVKASFEDLKTKHKELAHKYNCLSNHRPSLKE